MEEKKIWILTIGRMITLVEVWLNHLPFVVGAEKPNIPTLLPEMEIEIMSPFVLKNEIFIGREFLHWFERFSMLSQDPSIIIVLCLLCFKC